MPLFIYREYDDTVGEGTRAELHEYSQSSDAEAAYASFAEKSDTTYLKMILGAGQKEYRAGEESRTLTNDELISSSVIVDDSSKENI